jgi:hypothetical protein
MAETFKEKVCGHFNIPPRRYVETVLRLTLYPHARWLCLLESSEWLAPDRNFIAEVGRLTRWRGFSEIALDFQREPQNRLFWRRSVRLRVSVSRMRVLFSEVWGKSIPADAPQSPGFPSADDASSPLSH